MTPTVRFTLMVAVAAVLVLTVASVVTARDWVSTSPGVAHRIAVQTAAPQAEVPAAPASAPPSQANPPEPQPGDNPGQDGAPAAAVSTPQPIAAVGRAAVDEDQADDEHAAQPARHGEGNHGHHGGD